MHRITAFQLFASPDRAAAKQLLPDILQSAADSRKATTCCSCTRECSSNNGSSSNCRSGSSKKNSTVHLIGERPARSFSRNDILTAQVKVSSLQFTEGQTAAEAAAAATRRLVPMEQQQQLLLLLLHLLLLLQ